MWTGQNPSLKRVWHTSDSAMIKSEDVYTLKEIEILHIYENLNVLDIFTKEPP